MRWACRYRESGPASSCAIKAGLLCALLAGPVSAAPCVTDDAGREVCLEAPAERIVALSPGIVELLFAVGAGDRVVGAVSHTDYPEAARDIPRVGSSERLDMETLLTREPDLVIAWETGNPGEQVEQLERMGLPVYYSEQESFDDVASTLQRFGRLAGKEDKGRQAAVEFLEGLDALERRHGHAEEVRVFYQVWQQPLMTIGRDHLITETIRLCGGRNVFDDLEALVPRLDLESVLERDPEVVFSGGEGQDEQAWQARWQRLDSLSAVEQGNLFSLPSSLIARHTPRLVEGARLLCEHLEDVRERR